MMTSGVKNALGSSLNFRARLLRRRPNKRVEDHYESAQILADVVINDDLSEKPQHRIPFLKEETYDDGHGRVEKRAYYALPGSLLEGAEHWTGLHTGTLFVVDTEKTYKATKATGRQARTERFSSCRTLAVGPSGIPLVEFLRADPAALLS